MNLEQLQAFSDEVGAGYNGLSEEALREKLRAEGIPF